MDTRNVWKMLVIAGALAITGCGESGPDLAAELNQVTTGSLHSCGLTADGSAFCWGWNRDGQLGDGSSSNRDVPVAVTGGLSFTSITAGGGHTCGLSGGVAYCWGFDDNGQTGTGSAPREPTVVLGGLEFASISAGGAYSCGLTATGEAYCWGWNADGQLGDGTLIDRSEPTAVVGGMAFESISTGAFHTCAVTAAGDAYCWGRNAQGQLGNGTNTSSTEPVQVEAGGLAFTGVSVGFSHSCGVTPGGTGYCWGDDEFGQLGNAAAPASSTPTQVADVDNFSAVIGGAEFTCGLRTTGEAWCWGFNASGQLGADAAQACFVSDGISQTQVDCSNVPIAVSGGLSFFSVQPNTQHTCGIARSGGAYCWGFGDRGQLGNGMSGDNYLSIEPVRVAGQSGA